jgi:hypothetical protein
MLASVCFVVTAIGPVGALAQQGQQPAAASTQADPNERVGDLDFPGGTVAEYVAAIEKEFGPFNKVLAPEAAAIRVQPMKFTGVRFGDVILILRAVSDPQATGYVHVFKEQGTDIWRIGYTYMSGNQVVTAVPTELRVWTLRGLIEGGTRVEDILSAVETAVGLIGGSPKIRYHKDTGILIVLGTPQELDAANQVLKALEMAQHQAANAAERKADEAAKKAAASN